MDNNQRSGTNLQLCLEFTTPPVNLSVARLDRYGMEGATVIQLLHAESSGWVPDKGATLVVCNVVKLF